MSNNFLFICSRNQWRSRTAEHVFANLANVNVRSAGTSSSARIRVSEKLLEWADIIFVMEKNHKQIIKEKYPLITNSKRIVIMDIPDEYQFMDAELVEILQAGVEPYL